VARIVITTFGSLGDLHPSIAIALGLSARGHQPVLATSFHYREKVEATGLEFRALRPHVEHNTDPELMRRIMDEKRGPETVVRELLMPAVRESYEDLLEAAEGADLLVSHPITFAARLVAETRGLPWASTVTAPIVFFSPHDPPVLPAALWAARLRFLGPRFHGLLFRLVKRVVHSWAEPWRRLRSELGLPPVRESPIFEGQHSPFLVLALFSRLLAPKQPDWPRETVITGFPFYDRDGEPGLPPSLARFLEEGPPPIVFTLGSAAVMVPGGFYEESAEAARLLGRRAALLVGRDSPLLRAALPEGVRAFDYAPFSELFPRAAAIVHQGGVGTTGQAMRAGRPMLIVPFAHDQPDNAARIRRLGIGRVIRRGRYSSRTAARELGALLADPAYERRAAEVGGEVQAEDGVAAACDALEGLLARIRLPGRADRPILS
jgi:rhamnosyltransferase subunit B